MKISYTFFLLAATLFATHTVAQVSDEVLAREAKKQARSIHLTYAVPSAAWAYNEMTITQTTPGSFFMALGFVDGYFGLQELGDGSHIALFSVWDAGVPYDAQLHPEETAEPMRTKIRYAGKNVTVRRFGGEGTGGQSRMPFPWRVGETYRFAVHAENDGDLRLAYTAYIFNPAENQWFKMATFSTIRGKAHASVRSMHSFVEDFRRDYTSAGEIRRAVFSGACVIPANTATPTWIAAKQAYFTGDRNPVMTIDAGPTGNGWFLQTGGATTNVTAALNTAIPAPTRDLTATTPFTARLPIVNATPQPANAPRQ